MVAILVSFQIVGLLDFRSHSKSGPFAIQPLFDHSNSGQGRISDPHCIIHITGFPYEIFYIFQSSIHTLGGHAPSYATFVPPVGFVSMANLQDQSWIHMPDCSSNIRGFHSPSFVNYPPVIIFINYFNTVMI